MKQKFYLLIMFGLLCSLNIGTIVGMDRDYEKKNQIVDWNNSSGNGWNGNDSYNWGGRSDDWNHQKYPNPSLSQKSDNSDDSNYLNASQLNETPTNPYRNNLVNIKYDPVSDDSDDEEEKVESVTTLKDSGKFPPAPPVKNDNDYEEKEEESPYANWSTVNFLEKLREKMKNGGGNYEKEKEFINAARKKANKVGFNFDSLNSAYAKIISEELPKFESNLIIKNLENEKEKLTKLELTTFVREADTLENLILDTDKKTKFKDFIQTRVQEYLERIKKECFNYGTNEVPFFSGHEATLDQLIQQKEESVEKLRERSRILDKEEENHLKENWGGKNKKIDIEFIGEMVSVKSKLIDESQFLKDLTKLRAEVEEQKICYQSSQQENSSSLDNSGEFDNLLENFENQKSVNYVGYFEKNEKENWNVKEEVSSEKINAARLGQEFKEKLKEFEVELQKLMKDKECGMKGAENFLSNVNSLKTNVQTFLKQAEIEKWKTLVLWQERELEFGQIKKQAEKCETHLKKNDALYFIKEDWNFLQKLDAEKNILRLKDLEVYKKSLQTFWEDLKKASILGVFNQITTFNLKTFDEKLTTWEENLEAWVKRNEASILDKQLNKLDVIIDCSKLFGVKEMLEDQEYKLKEMENVFRALEFNANEEIDLNENDEDREAFSAIKLAHKKFLKKQKENELALLEVEKQLRKREKIKKQLSTVPYGFIKNYKDRELNEEDATEIQNKLKLFKRADEYGIKRNQYLNPEEKNELKSLYQKALNDTKLSKQKNFLVQEKRKLSFAFTQQTNELEQINKEIENLKAKPNLEEFQKLQEKVKQIPNDMKHILVQPKFGQNLGGELSNELGKLKEWRTQEAQKLVMTFGEQQKEIEELKTIHQENAENLIDCWNDQILEAHTELEKILDDKKNPNERIDVKSAKKALLAALQRYKKFFPQKYNENEWKKWETAIQTMPLAYKNASNFPNDVNVNAMRIFEEIADFQEKIIKRKRIEKKYKKTGQKILEACAPKNNPSIDAIKRNMEVSVLHFYNAVRGYNDSDKQKLRMICPENKKITGKLFGMIGDACTKVIEENIEYLEQSLVTLEQKVSECKYSQLYEIKKRVENMQNIEASIKKRLSLYRNQKTQLNLDKPFEYARAVEEKAQSVLKLVEKRKNLDKELQKIYKTKKSTIYKICPFDNHQDGEKTRGNITTVLGLFYKTEEGLRSDDRPKIEEVFPGNRTIEQRCIKNIKDTCKMILNQNIRYAQKELEEIEKNVEGEKENSKLKEMLEKVENMQGLSQSINEGKPQNDNHEYKLDTLEELNEAGKVDAKALFLKNLIKEKLKKN